MSFVHLVVKLSESLYNMASMCLVLQTISSLSHVLQKARISAWLYNLALLHFLCQNSSLLQSPAGVLLARTEQYLLSCSH